MIAISRLIYVDLISDYSIIAITIESTVEYILFCITNPQKLYSDRVLPEEELNPRLHDYIRQIYENPSDENALKNFANSLKFFDITKYFLMISFKDIWFKND